jgi:hypothetical protein
LTDWSARERRILAEGESKTGERLVRGSLGSGAQFLQKVSCLAIALDINLGLNQVIAVVSEVAKLGP